MVHASEEVMTPRVAGSAAQAASLPARMGIGEVLAALQEKYPEITISKIRFLESEGLISPERTASGYRKFSRTDVQRLDYILRVQRDHYLPLKVIRQHIDTLEEGQGYPATPLTQGRLEVEDGSLSSRSDGLTVTSDLLGDPAKTSPAVSQRDVLRAAGIDEQMLAALEEHGFVHASLNAQGDPVYSNLDVRVASIVRQMRTFGIEARHLRVVRTTVDREAGLIDQAVRPLSHQRGSEQVIASAVRLAELSIRLHAALLEGAVRENLADHQE